MRVPLAATVALLAVSSLIGASDFAGANTHRLEAASLITASIAFPPSNAINIADVDNLTSLIVLGLDLAPVNLTIRNSGGGTTHAA
jgi:hypothetical protein